MSSISETERDIIVKRREFDGTIVEINLCVKYDDKYHVPFLYGREFINDKKYTDISDVKYTSEFYGKLRDYQKKDYKDAIKMLNEHKSVFLCLHCGLYNYVDHPN